MRLGITCYPTHGGSGVFATELGKQLALRGHTISFISYAAPLRLVELPPRVTFHEVQAGEYPLLKQFPYTLALAAKMVEVAAANALRILHVHYAIPFSPAAILARQMAPELNLKVVTTLHGTDTSLVRAAFNAAVPATERARFAALRRRLSELWQPLEAHVTAADPNLAHTWRRSLGHAERAAERLEERTARALMSRRGAARRALQRLRDEVWPRARPQERVLPAAHFVSRYGPQLPGALLAACDPLETDHELLVYDVDGACD